MNAQTGNWMPTTEWLMDSRLKTFRTVKVDGLKTKPKQSTRLEVY